MTASVPLPAWTMMIAVRGFDSEATKSSICSEDDEAGLRVGVHQLFGARVGAVEHGDRVALAGGEVAGEVRAHHRQTDDSDVGGCFL